MMGNVQQGMLAEDTLRFSNAWTRSMRLTNIT
jgi:hypothetical protein